MPKTTETILLDIKKYNHITRKWEVPILKIKDVKPVSVFLDSHELPSSKYKIENNQITFYDGIEITHNCQVHLLIDFETSSKNVSIWIPVIVAIIGLIGISIQKVSPDFIFGKKRIFRIQQVKFSYEQPSNQLQTNIEVLPVGNRLSLCEIPIEDFEKWDIYVAVKAADGTKDAEDQEYNYFAGPLKLRQGSIESIVLTDSSFTRQIKGEGEKLQLILALVKKGMQIKKPFSPASLGSDLVKVISTSRFNLHDNSHF